MPSAAASAPPQDAALTIRGDPLPALWRGAALLTLGVAALLALVGGDSPPPGHRELTTLALTLFTLIALLSTLRRRSVVSEITFLDGLVIIALLTAAVAALHAPIRSAAFTALMWQASLVGLYLGARLIGPFIAEPALALWALALAGLWVIHHFAPSHLDGTALLEWTLALGLLAACWGRQAWARRISTLKMRNIRRAILSGLILLAAAIHLLHVSGGDLGELLHQRSLSWRVARMIAWHYPLWGWGGGTWEWAVGSLPQPTSAGGAPVITAGMWLFAAGGAAGLLVAAVLGVALFATLMAQRRETIPSRMSTALMAVGAIGIAWLLMGLWSLAPLRPANLIVFVFLTGTSLSGDLLEVTEKAPLARPHPWLRLAVWWASLSVGVALLVTLSLSLWLSWWTRATSAPLAFRRAHVAGLLMPWETRWPELEAKMAGLWIVQDPTADVDRLRRLRAAAFTRARRLNPYQSDYYAVPAEELLLRGESEQAEALLRQGLVHCPLDAEMRWDLAGLLEERGELEGAYEALRQLDRIHPTGPSKVSLARLAWALGNRDLARRFAREALQLDNRSPALMALVQEMESWPAGS
jgi:hypothetical protein